MVLGIDASNVSSGGGISHLKNILSESNSVRGSVHTVHLWANSSIIDKLPRRNWLILHSSDWCSAGLFRRVLGQQFQLPAMAKRVGCEVIFSPGGILPIFCSIPTVTMSQNMLPFEYDRSILFGRWSWMHIKMRLLRHSQSIAFRRADGVIYLTKYARDVVAKSLGKNKGLSALIPHGIESRFHIAPRSRQNCQNNIDQTLQILYVSIQLPYKHHIEVLQAIADLRQRGCDMALYMVGESVGTYGKTVKRVRLSLDPEQSFLYDLGHVDFDQLHELYQNADMFLFASSCENLPNILIEAMAAGLPIACSNRGPMPEVLGDAGVYFDPESTESITQVVNMLAKDPDLRDALARRAWDKAQNYSWERCASQTFDFISQVVLHNKTKGKLYV